MADCMAIRVCDLLLEVVSASREDATLMHGGGGGQVDYSAHTLPRLLLFS